MKELIDIPELDKDAFICPLCNVFSHMEWNFLYSNDLEKRVISMAGYVNNTCFKSATCKRCKMKSYWFKDRSNKAFMVYPKICNAPMPNNDIPDSCREDYMEARDISDVSPRGAAALLRLCIQKLCKELGATGKNINKDIATLVKNGLPVKIQKALDTVRVIGNNAVHPGEISVDEQPETVKSLFNLINLIIDSQITQPKQIAEMYNNLPKNNIEAIERRDKNR